MYPAARDRLNFPELLDEGLEPWKVRQVLVSGVEQPNLLLDVSATFEIGLEALFCHVSQIDDRAEVEAGVRERAAERGRARRACRWPGLPLDHPGHERDDR